MSTNLNDQLLAVIPVPLDPKRTNCYVAGASIVIETIAQYLLRVTPDIRDTHIVSMVIPKTGHEGEEGAYPIADFSTVLANFNVKTYAFIDGLADGDFMEVVSNLYIQNQNTSAQTANQWVSGEIKGGTAKLGGVSDYSEFEPDGTLKFNGEATTWQDIDFPIIIRTTGANIPTLETLHGNITMPRWQVDDFNVCESQEFVHQWKEESEIHWHIHLTTSAVDGTNRYVRFLIEYGYVTPSGVWVFPANIDSGDLLIPANTPDRTMFIMSLGNFTPQAGTRIGGHCVARLRRIAAVGAAPSVDPFVPMLQQHIQCDTVGSRSISSK